MDLLERAKKNGASIYLQTAGINIFSVERDIAAISTEINDNEKIYLIAAGKLAQISNDRLLGVGSRGYTGTDTKGVIVITNEKVLFMDKRIFGKQSIIIEGEQISSVESASGIISAKVIIHSFGSRYNITDLKKDAALKIIEVIKKLRKEIKNSTNGKSINNISGMDEIKKAKTMFDDGIISKEEFQKIKDKYL